MVSFQELTELKPTPAWLWAGSASAFGFRRDGVSDILLAVRFRAPSKNYRNRPAGRVLYMERHELCVVPSHAGPLQLVFGRYMYKFGEIIMPAAVGEPYLQKGHNAVLDAIGTRFGRAIISAAYSEGSDAPWKVYSSWLCGRCADAMHRPEDLSRGMHEACSKIS